MIEERRREVDLEHSQLECDGFVAILDVLQADGSFQRFGNVPEGIEVRWYGDGPESIYGPWEGEYFLFDPTKIEVQRFSGMNPNAMADRARQAREEGWNVLGGEIYVKGDPVFEVVCYKRV